MSADIGSLLQKLDRRAISRHIKQFNNVILLLQSRCDGDYISTYHSMASKNLKIILVPDDADTVRTDHARRFALYHELGHTTPLNAGIFARRYFDGAFFLILQTFAMISYRAGWWDIWHVFPFMPYLTVANAIYDGHRIQEDCDVDAECHADNVAMWLAFHFNDPIFNEIEAAELPDNPRLGKNNGQLRRERFEHTRLLFREKGIFDNKHELTFPRVWRSVIVFGICVFVGAQDTGLDYGLRNEWTQVIIVGVFVAPAFLIARRVRNLSNKIRAQVDAVTTKI